MPTPTNARPRNRSGVIALACVVLLLVGGIGWLLYSMMSIGYQDTAIGGLRQITSAEERFSKAHPNLGYTCSFDQLKGSGYDWGAERNGVVFALSGCDAHLPNRTYRVTALHPRGDIAAFCSDQSGVVRYEPLRSLEKCIASGTPL